MCNKSAYHLGRGQQRGSVHGQPPPVPRSATAPAHAHRGTHPMRAEHICVAGRVRWAQRTCRCGSALRDFGLPNPPEFTRSTASSMPSHAGLREGRARSGGRVVRSRRARRAPARAAQPSDPAARERSACMSAHLKRTNWVWHGRHVPRGAEKTKYAKGRVNGGLIRELPGRSAAGASQQPAVSALLPGRGAGRGPAPARRLAVPVCVCVLACCSSLCWHRFPAARPRREARGRVRSRGFATPIAGMSS